MRQAHQYCRPAGRQSTAQRLAGGLHQVARFPIVCQTFYQRQPHLRYFPVQLGTQSTAPVSIPRAGAGVGEQEQLQETRSSNNASTSAPLVLSLAEQVERQLAQKLTAATEVAIATQTGIGEQHRTQASSWLDTTQWLRYLKGHDLVQAAQLIDLPLTLTTHQRQPEPQLVLLLDSFERLVDRAYDSICTNKVNIFDLHRAASFIAHRSADKPLLYKLQGDTYKKYKKVWKQLLCFVFRRVWQHQGPNLPYVLTSTQSTTLGIVVQAIAKVKRQGERGYKELDDACLLFWVWN